MGDPVQPGSETSYRPVRAELKQVFSSVAVTVCTGDSPLFDL